MLLGKKDPLKYDQKAILATRQIATLQSCCWFFFFLTDLASIRGPPQSVCAIYFVIFGSFASLWVLWLHYWGLFAFGHCPPPACYKVERLQCHMIFCNVFSIDTLRIKKGATSTLHVTLLFGSQPLKRQLTLSLFRSFSMISMVMVLRGSIEYTLIYEWLGVSIRWCALAWTTWWLATPLVDFIQD